MLVAAAAERWKVAPDSITVSRGTVVHAPSSRSARFGSLAAAAAKQPVPQEVKLKEAKDFVFIGRRVPRTDTRAKSNGTALYTQDVKLPGMLTALVAHPPRFGGKVKSFDASKAKEVKGVTDVVAIPGGVAVLASDFLVGEERPRFAVDRLGRDRGVQARLGRDHGGVPAARGDAGPPARKEGDVAAALASAAKTFEAVYEFPYLAHATMEPMNCVVRTLTRRAFSQGLFEVLDVHVEIHAIVETGMHEPDHAIIDAHGPLKLGDRLRIRLKCCMEIDRLTEFVDGIG